MTTITKEQVHAVSDLKAVYTLGHADVAILQRLARIALASLEAEGKLSNFVASQESLGGDFEKVLAENIEELYVPSKSAAPAPVVPDEIRNRLKAEGLAELLKDASENAPLTTEQWETLTNNWFQTFAGLSGNADACRAAMLQGVDGNSPVIPDGWVACSARMPDEYDFDIWVFSLSQGVRDGIQWDGEEFADDEYQCKLNDVSHWMKKIYPAAPQQEVK